MKSDFLNQRLLLVKRVQAVIGYTLKRGNEYLRITNYPGIELDSEDWVTVEAIVTTKEEHREFTLNQLLN